MYDHVWNLFAVHADQRMSLFRFYLIVLLAIIAGYMQAWFQESFGVCFAVAVLGVFITRIFLGFDERSKYLIKLSETPLKWAECKFTEIEQSGEWDVICRSDQVREKDPKLKTFGHLYQRP